MKQTESYTTGIVLYKEIPLDLHTVIVWTKSFKCRSVE